jgi:hypothetical protein
MTQKDLKILSDNDSFARFIHTIKLLREETIQDLHESSSDRIQQVSGRIITYDQILKMVDSESLLARHHERLNQ